MSESADFTTSEIFRRAKLEALAEFAAGAGHEINNPVATIAGRVELLLKDESNPERRQTLLNIRAQALRIRDMIGDVMLFARPPKPDPKPLDLIVVVDEVTGKLADTFRGKSLSVTRQGDTSVPILADPVQLRIVISNLLHNGVQASKVGEAISLECSKHDEADRVWALLTVKDHGVGFSPIEQAHLFDPFFSGRQAGRGLGFGLPKCWRIVEQHGGRMNCLSSAEAGTTFHVYWPASATT